MTWIYSIERVVIMCKDDALDVYLVHYSPVAKGSVQELFDKKMQKLDKGRVLNVKIPSEQNNNTAQFVFSFFSFFSLFFPLLTNIHV